MVNPTHKSQREFLHFLLDRALATADPARCVPPYLPEPGPGRTVVVGAGKAAAAMARAVEDNWDGPLEGLVTTRYGHTVPCDRIEVVEAAHPVPDAAGRDAARRILELVGGLTANDLALCLISGGGSSLLSLPAPPLDLEDKQDVNRALLKSGATIHEMNTVRKHLSAIKGGRLAAAAAPARVVTLTISDVPGDDPSVIASGPTVPDVTTSADAIEILEKYGIDVPGRVAALLRSADSETPKPGDPGLAGSEIHMIATPQAMLEEAASAVEAAGLTAAILSDRIEGETRDVAAVHAAIARQVAAHGQPVAPPAVLLSGGETTVTVRGDGRGGPNAEFLLALAIALDGLGGVYALACDTDGIDGTEDNAGAFVAPDTLARARVAGLDRRDYLGRNDGYAFFEALGDLIKTGPTLTNVNDFRAILIEARYDA
ncbi:MAG: glycerate kinase [Alphaproteobacteria bacterium]|nr:glycerate kinase [Alphaproteobacteria bacterium]